jgi:4-aminobutyrate aminotransferase-like enzyme/Ser/Thr protein kinase RdoA (MazF antagonist)
MTAETNPPIDSERAAALARQYFGLEGEVSDLPSYIDQNFRLQGTQSSYVLKFAHAAEQHANLDLENQLMRRLAEFSTQCRCPQVLESVDGESIVEVPDGIGAGRFMRVVSFLDGVLLADARPYVPGLMRVMGRSLGSMDDAFVGFEHPAMDREMSWDLARAAEVASHLGVVEDPEMRRIVSHFILQFLARVGTEIPNLRRSVVHNDANDLNVLVGESAAIGVIDFGDAVRTCTVFNLAIAAAYAVFDAEDPVATLCDLVAGYNESFPLEERELAVVFPALCMRLCVTFVLAAADAAERPDNNEYILVSQRPARAMLRTFWAIDPSEVHDRLRTACGFELLGAEVAGRVPEALLARRAEKLGPSLSVSYRDPLKIVRGKGQYLFDERGRGYLDCVNNVCHVGHCHPRVVAAAQQQIARLNTNTRYLHDNLVEYAERLTACFPNPLSVCFLVCSGSEANELAMRMARAHTGRKDWVVLDVGYHGNTTGLVDLSAYKHAGPGGEGCPEHVHVADLPCGYRGLHRYGTADIGPRYAESVAQALDRAAQRGGAAVFFVESISGCGGQVEYPEGYLASAFEHARNAGALCVSDEVQVGFGRVGSHMWAFETQGVVPDIVTLGKPIGNGHPIGAVITTPEIAASFDNGMEYFNTFGGNPVSCATGLAVLDVLESEDLMHHAEVVGSRLLEGLKALQSRFEILGDVRGRGLFLGVEMVRDADTREPAAEELATIVERMKNAGILLSTDGRFHNVLKFKPPMPFSLVDAELLLESLDRVLTEMYPV